MAIRQPRAERRDKEPYDTRVRLLEDDADISDLRQSAIESKLDRILIFAVGSTATFAASSLLLAINIIRGG